MPRKKHIAVDGLSRLPELPLVPVRDTVLYPRLMSPLTVGRERSIRAIEAAMAKNQFIVVFLQRDPETQEPGADDLYTVGTEVAIGRMLRMPDGTTSLIGQAKSRVKLVEIVQTDPFLRARVMPIYETTDKKLATEALMRAVLALYEKVVHLRPNLPDDAYVAAMNADQPGWLADLASSTLNLDLAKRQELLETLDPTTRLQKISILLAKELDVLELQSKIHNQVQEEVDKTQREFYLREQIGRAHV